MSHVYELLEYKTLLAGIIAHPEDDLRRLVTADWLEEHGQEERAEFVRLQIELAGMDAAGVGKWKGLFSRSYRALRARERHLLINRAPNWMPGVQVITATTPRMVQRAGTGVIYRRGFVTEARCPLEWWAGNPCGNCHGITDRELGVGTAGARVCIKCRGARRTPDHGPTIAAAHPVQFVTVTNFYLAESAGTPPPVWPLYRTDSFTRGHCTFMPDDVFDALSGGELNPGNYCRHYLTREAAMGALSNALIAWAKRQPAA